MKKTTRATVLGVLDDVESLFVAKDEAIIIAARIRADLQKVRPPIGAYDLPIAATALNNDLILVTSNEKELSRIPDLATENCRLPE